MFKNVYGMNPVDNCIKVQWVCHNRDLRSNSKSELVIGRTHTKFADANMFIRGPRAWAQLPINMRQIESLIEFKRTIKNYNGFIHIR